MKELLRKAETVEAYLPGVESLKDFIGKADDWKAKAVSILVRFIYQSDFLFISALSSHFIALI